MESLSSGSSLDTAMELRERGGDEGWGGEEEEEEEEEEKRGQNQFD